MPKNHTIVLYEESGGNRTYFEKPSSDQALEEIIKMFETRLKKTHPDYDEITYEIKHLFEFIDTVGDMGFLVFDGRKQAYVPCGKDGVKDKMYEFLKKQASQ
eukprot:TRINITY_DN3474_c0_g1_i1.p1 TRINITY_DN3474_c0_g1~~TRINITY_DN3474_c0_g1_i1.p1  ORF type:complete len:102 (+),score=26.30 TRINITY_DN3474_c0_g1_i1:61-366(+)